MTDTTFTSVGEAIAFITDAIEDATGVADARSEYDIYAIADEVIGVHSDRTHDGTTIGTSEYFSIDADEDTFWATVADHELTGPITAELTTVDTPAVIDGRETTTDTITITRDGVELDAIDIESSEDAEPYDIAVRSIIGDQPFTWIR